MTLEQRCNDLKTLKQRRNNVVLMPMSCAGWERKIILLVLQWSGTLTFHWHRGMVGFFRTNSQKYERAVAQLSKRTNI